MPDDWDAKLIHFRELIVIAVLIITALILSTDNCFAEDSALADSESYDIHIDTEEYCIKARNVSFDLSELKDMDEATLKKEIIKRSEPVIYLRYEGETWPRDYLFTDISEVKKEVTEDGYDVWFYIREGSKAFFSVKVFVASDIEPVAPSEPERAPEVKPKEENKAFNKVAAQPINPINNQDLSYENIDAVEDNSRSVIDNKIENGKKNKTEIYVGILFYILTIITLLFGGALIYSDIKLLKWCGWSIR